MPKLAPMGLGLLRKGRINLIPKRIKQMGQLTAILDKAKALEEALRTENSE
jgi:hypothetical protein